MNILECKNVTLGYEKQIVVNNLSFKVKEGSYLCIIGENGSGKTTLMKGILGLLKLNGGKIILLDNLKRTEIGYLPQMTNAQKDFPASVYEVVLSGFLNSQGFLPFYKKEIKKKAKEAIKKFKIDKFKNKCFRELSGGQQRKVLLARSICSTKRILLLDEPTSGLDPVASEEFYNLIDDINKKDNITIIMISHDIKSALKYSTHILHLNNENTFYGTKNEYLKISNLLGGDIND